MWGATRYSPSGCNFFLFQSTHPCGVRPNWQHSAIDRECFNPRTRVGCDKLNNNRVFIMSVSIHAPVWGATSGFSAGSRTGSFQSTHPCGVRLISSNSSSLTLLVSIHAPVWGATTHAVVGRYCECFNPRTRVGCDAADSSGLLCSMFQSTHPCGVRH